VVAANSRAVNSRTPRAARCRYERAADDDDAEDDGAAARVGDRCDDDDDDCPALSLPLSHTRQRQLRVS